LTWTSALRRRDAEPGTALLALHVTTAARADETAAHLLKQDVETVCGLFDKDCAGVEISRQLVDGVPSPAILSAAERDSADLIVMGTRGKQWQDAELGSVSVDVVTRARRPVLLVPPGIWQLPD
jgi:nucleotide-binding universal stress UspA family protein